MSFYEIPYAEGVTFVRRTAQVFPDTDAGTVTGRASYQFQNASARSRAFPSASTRATPFPMSRPTARTFPLR